MGYVVFSSSVPGRRVRGPTVLLETEGGENTHPLVHRLSPVPHLAGIPTVAPHGARRQSFLEGEV